MDHVQGQICQTEDALLQYRMLKRENAVSRIVSMTSELLGPNVDERCGLRDKWLAVCRSRQRKSPIGDYIDNRFNWLFRGTAQAIFHLNEVLELENRLKTKFESQRHVFGLEKFPSCCNDPGCCNCFYKDDWSLLEANHEQQHQLYGALPSHLTSLLPNYWNKPLHQRSCLTKECPGCSTR